MTNVGWKCPVCGAGVAPTVQKCEHPQQLGLSLPTFVIAPPNTVGEYINVPVGTYGFCYKSSDGFCHNMYCESNGCVFDFKPKPMDGQSG
jgi:hypothetical protein